MLFIPRFTVEHLPQMPVSSVQNAELTSRFRGNHVFIFNLKLAQASSKHVSGGREDETGERQQGVARGLDSPPYCW